MVDMRTCENFDLLTFFGTTLVASIRVILKHFFISNLLNAGMRNHVFIEEGINVAFTATALSLSKHYTKACLLAELLENFAVHLFDRIVSIF